MLVRLLWGVVLCGAVVIGGSSPAHASSSECSISVYTFTTSVEAHAATESLSDSPQHGGPRGARVLDHEATIQRDRGSVIVLTLDSPQPLGEVRATASGYGGVRTTYDRITHDEYRSVIGPLTLSEMHTGTLSVSTHSGVCELQLRVIAGSARNPSPPLVIGAVLGVLLSITAVLIRRRRVVSRVRRVGVAALAAVAGAGAGGGFALVLYERGVFDPLSLRGYLLAAVCALAFGVLGAFPARAPHVSTQPHTASQRHTRSSDEPLTLGEYCATRTLTPEQAIGVTVCLSEQLQRVHTGGLVHGSISRETVHIRGDTAYLSGFTTAAPAGVARTSSDSYTPYSSPEHAQGRGMDARSDVYSLGALLIHLLTGCAVSNAQGVRRVPDFVTEYGLHPTLADVLSSSVSYDPQSRYSSVDTFAVALRDAAAAAYGPVWEARVALAEEPTESPQEPPSERRESRFARVRGDVIAGSVALALVLGVSTAAVSAAEHEDSSKQQKSVLTPVQARSVATDVWSKLTAAAPRDGRGVTPYLDSATHSVFAVAYQENRVRPAVLTETVVPRITTFPATFSVYALTTQEEEHRKNPQSFDVFLQFTREKESTAWIITTALILDTPRAAPRFETDDNGYVVRSTDEQTSLVIPSDQLPESYVRYLTRSVQAGYPLEEQFFQEPITRAEITQAANALHRNLNTDLGGDVQYTAEDTIRDVQLADGARFLQFTAVRRDRYSNSPNSLEGEECSEDAGRYLSPHEPTDEYPRGKYRRVEFVSHLRITAMVSDNDVEILQISYFTDSVKPVPCTY